MGVIGRARYRVWQFWRSIRKVPLRPEDQEEIAKILSLEEMNLFLRQSLTDKRHSLRVMRKLKESGHMDNDLLAAAVLHDVGKTNLRTAWWDRPVVVLAESIMPSNAERWANGTGDGWSRPFLIKAKHAEWGADAASAMGSAALTGELIRRHDESSCSHVERDPDSDGSPTQPESERLLALLQWADGIN